MNRRLVWNVSKYVLAFGLLAFVIWRNWDPAPPSGAEGQQTLQGTGLKYVWERHVVQGEPIHYGFFAAACVLGLASTLLTLGRWYLLVRAVGLPFTPANALRLGMIGIFFNAFLPGSIGGDAIKAAFLAREHSRRTVAVATVIMDRAIALWALIWFVAIAGVIFWSGGLLQGQGEQHARIIIVTALVTVGVSVLVWIGLGFLPPHRAERFAGRLGRIPKVGGSAAEFWRAVWMYRCQQRVVAQVMLISWVGHVGFVFMFYFSALTLLDGNAAIPTLAEHFLLVPIGLVIQAAPLFPGGAGIGEAGFGGLYQWFHCAYAYGVLASLVYRVATWIIGLVGGVVYQRMKPALQTVAEPERELTAA